jgi:hypothetical protein
LQTEALTGCARRVAHIDKFPSSAAFDAINDALNSNEEERKNAIKQGNGVYAFTLKNSAGEQESWHIDLKEAGKVGTGLGNKPSGMAFTVYSLLSHYADVLRQQ